MPHTASALRPDKVALFDIRDLWRAEDYAAAKAMLPGYGFSFDYGGKPTTPAFGSEWERIRPDLDDRTTQQIVLKHVSGLMVTRQSRWLERFGAVEYKIILENTSDDVLPAISRLHSLDLSFGDPLVHGSCIVSSGGGMFDGTYPPDSFAVRRKYFPRILDEFSAVSSMIDLTTEGGRSSSKDLPFFFLHHDSQRIGLFVGIGWSGQWTVRASIDPKNKALNITGKIPGLDIALQPGEQIEGPSILVGMYQGDVSDGSNQLRRLISEIYAPTLAGRRFQPVATYDTWYGGIGTQFDEGLLRKVADAAALLGQEYFLLDGGWVGDDNGGWGQGNWYQVNRTKLPNGLRPIADHVRSKGLKFGLWFDLEMVACKSELAEQHPDWILWDCERGSSSQEDFLKRWTADRGLLDYGRPEVQEWVCNLLDHYVREYDIKYIRYDFNAAPLPFWDAKDIAGRRGITQLQYIRGFYNVMDWLRSNHPEVVIESCASGGRRIDLETVRRSHVFWISDYTVDPEVLRFNLAGINCFLPGHYHYVQYTLPSIYQEQFEPDDLGFQSMFGGAFGFGGRIDLWPDSMRQKAQRHIGVWKQLRRYLNQSYYPLTDQPRDLAYWSGWQFHDPVDQSGFVQTFRTSTHHDARRFVLKDLDSKAQYQFEDAYDHSIVIVVAGATATTEGIGIAQPPMSSRVFFYKKL